jgi:C4-dicarboxylate transporter, DctM subunit
MRDAAAVVEGIDNRVDHRRTGADRARLAGDVSGETIALLGFVALLALRVPVGFSMILVGLAGFAAITGRFPALRPLAQSPIRTATDEAFGVVPMFMLMGAFVAASALSGGLFNASDARLGLRIGGLAMVEVAAFPLTVPPLPRTMG